LTVEEFINVLLLLERSFKTLVEGKEGLSDVWDSKMYTERMFLFG